MIHFKLSTPCPAWPDGSGLQKNRIMSNLYISLSSVKPILIRRGLLHTYVHRYHPLVNIKGIVAMSARCLLVTVKCWLDTVFRPASNSIFYLWALQTSQRALTSIDLTSCWCIAHPWDVVHNVHDAARESDARHHWTNPEVSCSHTSVLRKTRLHKNLQSC